MYEQTTEIVGIAIPEKMMVVIFHGIPAIDLLSDSVHPKKHFGRLDHAPDTTETVLLSPVLSSRAARSG